MPVGRLTLADGVVALRDWTAADVDELARWLGPEHEWRKFNAPYLPLPTPEQQQTALNELRNRAGAVVLPTPRESLVISDQGNRFLGEVSWYWESQSSNWRRLGVALYDPEVWGRGVGTRAVALWTTYLFEKTTVRRLDYATWSGNIGMLRIGQRLGFVEEGRFRDARIVDDVAYDAVVMGVLRREWRPRHV